MKTFAISAFENIDNHYSLPIGRSPSNIVYCKLLHVLMLHSFFLFRWFLAPSPWPTMRTSFRYSFIVPHESEIKLSDHKMYLFNVQMCHNTWILCIVQQPYVQTYKISNIKSKPFMTFFFVKLKDYWQWRCSEKTDNLGWPSIPLAPNEIISHLMKPG